MRVVLCLLVLAGLSGVCEPQRIKKEYYMTTPQLVIEAGYPCEKHRIETEDGYILQLHRIPAGKRSPRLTNQHSRKGKNAILIVHGLMGSSGDFIIMGPKKSLAYLLADAGYDVWLGNLRGTIYSSHKYYTKNNPKFWNFSFHEHGLYDAPAMIDTVLNVTGLSKIMYLGYSMGTTTFFTMMSERPEYNDKIHNFVALAPAVYFNTSSSANKLSAMLEVKDLMRAAGMVALSLGRDVLDFLVSTVCNEKQPRADVCANSLFAFVGEDYDQYDGKMYSIILRRVQPASWRQVEHYAKIAVTGVFTSWEGGQYNSVRPYNISNVRVPVTILYGENDQLTEKSEIIRLARDLKELGVLESVSAGCSFPKFNHLDFAFARDVDTLLNEPLVRRIKALFNKYAPN